MKTYELGKKITVDSFLVRKHIYKGTDTPYNESWKIWKEINFDAEKEVLIIGIRNLSNGRLWHNSEEGNTYDAKEYFKALLVVEKLSSKPFYIKIP